MTMRRIVLIVLSLGLFVAVLPTPVQAAAAYFETMVVTDTANDYQQGALDLVAVYISEKYRYNADNRFGEEVFVFRFEPRDLAAMPCNTALQYEVSFTANGQTSFVAGGVQSTFSTGSNACTPTPVDITGKTSIQGGSVSVTVASAGYNVPIGTLLTEFYALSYLVPPAGDPVPQDVAPHNNNNAPQSAPPETGMLSYLVLGTFPFILVEPTTPLNQYSVNGGEVEYSFNFFAHEQARDEFIRVRFNFPTGWSISPSQGNTGVDPEGQLTAANDGAPREFSFTMNSNGVTENGDVATVIMEVISASGGHVNVTTLTTISSSKIVDPNITFALETPGPFTAGETTELRVKVVSLGPDVSNARLSVDIGREGARMTTFEAESVGNGTYAAMVRFPGEGTFTVDAYLSSLKPSPHQTFAVQVKEGGGLAPGLEAGVLAVALLVLAVWRRRIVR